MRIFEHDITVTIGSTNMEGNVYWVEFLRWFGEARELFLINLLPDIHMPDYLMEREVAIVTCNINTNFIRSAYFTDQVNIKVYAEKVENCSAVLGFEITNKKTGEILAKGNQKIAFINISNQRPVRIPKELKESVKEYLQDN
ncbi:MAG: acyl-CoA thioesterase [bacterium]